MVELGAEDSCTCRDWTACECRGPSVIFANFGLCATAAGETERWMGNEARRMRGRATTEPEVEPTLLVVAVAAAALGNALASSPEIVGKVGKE